MSFDPKELEGLAGVLIEKGAPILGGIIGGPVGAIVGTVVPKIAQAFGLGSDASPSEVLQAVQADPDASSKLSTLEEEHRAEQSAADAQLAANQSYLESSIGFGQKLLFAGARPVMMWVSGPLLLVYQVVALIVGYTLLPFDFFAASQATFGLLCGFRTTEKWKGVATDQQLIRKRK